MKMASFKKVGAYLLVSVLMQLTAYEITEKGFDDLLVKSSYEQLLKELICMTDVIGLLQHRMHEDERRFVEDNVLGKILRISRLIHQVDVTSITIDVDYLLYWIELAKSAIISQFIADEIQILEQKLHENFNKEML